MIITRALTKRYGAVTAVRSVDLDVREGDRYGLLGPNGSGKTTLVRMLLGLVFATSGQIEIDGHPLSRWGGDGGVCSTPTGSTAYAFSAGGPVVWPEVEALLMVPISAHALFAPPMVVSPQSVLAVELIVASETSGAVLWCDGRRKVDLPPGARVEVRRGTLPVLLARLQAPDSRGGGFTDRLVAKFGLPVAGWRGRTWEDAGKHA